MSKVLKRVRAGRLVSAVIYTAATARASPRIRAQQQHASSLAREKLNVRTSFEKLERLLAANFDDGDLWVTLTYEDKWLPEDRDGAISRMRAFFKELRSARNARGQPTKYVYNVEGCFPGGRIHNHMVLNSTGADVDELRQLWKYGMDIEIQRLEFNDLFTYEDLAAYLTKEPREWGHPQVGERTWIPSLNLVHPHPETDKAADDVTLTIPPGATVLSNEGPIKNGWGEYTWVKYLLPRDPGHKRPRAKRRKAKKE